MRILIVFGSRRGGSKGIAERIAVTLIEAGHHVDLRAGEQLDGLGGYDAAIVGAGLYAGRWVRSARRFVERHVAELRQMPVWMFSSGPLDDSASNATIAATAQVARLMTRIGARGHATFGGALPADSKGFIARALVQQGHAGDFRDMDAVTRWAREIAEQLASVTVMVTARPTAAERPVRLALVGLCWFTGVTAAIGGVPLTIHPHESMPTTLLAGTPFADFLVPGLLLTGVVGLGNLLAGTLVLRRHRIGELAAVAAGVALTTWIVVQVLMIGASHWLQALYLTVGVITIAGAAWLDRRRRGSLRERQTATADQPRPIRQVPTPAITS